MSDYRRMLYRFQYRDTPHNTRTKLTRYLYSLRNKRVRHIAAFSNKYDLKAVQYPFPNRVPHARYECEVGDKFIPVAKSFKCAVCHVWFENLTRFLERDKELKTIDNSLQISPVLSVAKYHQAAKDHDTRVTEYCQSLKTIRVRSIFPRLTPSTNNSIPYCPLSKKLRQTVRRLFPKTSDLQTSLHRLDPSSEEFKKTLNLLVVPENNLKTNERMLMVKLSRLDANTTGLGYKRDSLVELNRRHEHASRLSDKSLHPGSNLSRQRELRVKLHRIDTEYPELLLRHQSIKNLRQEPLSKNLSGEVNRSQSVLEARDARIQACHAITSITSYHSISETRDTKRRLRNSVSETRGTKNQLQKNLSENRNTEGQIRNSVTETKDARSRFLNSQESQKYYLRKTKTHFSTI